MNVGRLKKLRDHVENLPTWRSHETDDTPVFDMSRYVNNSCGTPLCLAGWTVHLFGALGDHMQSHSWGRVYHNGGIHHAAKDLLGLTEEQAERLFVPEESSMLMWPEDFYLEDITPDHAVETINHLLGTGEVVWPFEEELS